MELDCDIFPFRVEGVPSLRSLERDNMLQSSELTWHGLMCGLGLPLEVFSKVIRDEEIVDGSLVRSEVLSVRSNGSVEVVLKLAVLAYV